MISPEEILTDYTIKPIIEQLVTSFIVPKLKIIKSKFNLFSKKEHFEEYLYRTYKKHSTINTLVLKNSQRSLKDLYIPLTIYKENLFRDTENITKICGYPIKLLKKYKRIIIADRAGMGKSTLTKRLLIDIIENKYGIPIYIEMRRLNKTNSIINEIKNQLDPFGKEFDLRIINKLIKTGEFIFILDGYDEISSSDKSYVTSQIQDFISKTDMNTFILTSRPEDSITCFGDFQCFKIKPLTKDEAYDLLSKYDNKGDISKLLISELDTRKHETINEFLKNPLLVSLLYAAFDHKQTIPLKKHIFYRQIYDAYFDAHDLSKGGGYKHEKLSSLDIDSFDRILRSIGFKCLKLQKIEFYKDELLKIISESKEECSDLYFKVSDFYQDILHAVPLFCNDGQYIKWVHKSIQEYFAAQYIYKDAKENQDKILTTIYQSKNLPKYINLLDIYYDIDNWGFKKNILKPICEEYCLFYEQNIKIYKNKNFIANDIDDRIGNIFMQEALFFQYDTSKNLSPRELVNNFYDIIGPHLNNKINSTTFYNQKNLFVSSYIYPKTFLIRLLYNKYPIIFQTSNPAFIDGEIPLTYETIYKVDLHSFENNYRDFIIANNLLIRNNTPYHNFNYDKCKEEINKIESMLAIKNSTSTIVDGL